MADHRMNERAGSEARASTDVPGCWRTPGCAATTQGPAGLLSNLKKPRTQLLFGATGAYRPPGANALLTLDPRSIEHMRSKAFKVQDDQSTNSHRKPDNKDTNCSPR